jgi:putative peptidoglycan lipid II flippase
VLEVPLPRDSVSTPKTPSTIWKPLGRVPIDSLALQTLAVATGLFLSRALAFVRDMIIAAHFGASAQTDAYLISAQVPLVFDSFMAGGALYGALMPVAAACIASRQPDERLKYLLRNSTTLVLLTGATAAVLGGIFSPWLARAFGAGLNVEAHATATKLIAITMLGLPFLGLTNITWVALNAKGHFWGPALAQSLSNITLIAFALLLVRPMGIYALGIGYVVGAIVQVLPQYSELHRMNLPLRLDLNLRDPDLQATLGAFWPLAIGNLVFVMNPAVDNFFASFLAPGSVTAIRYAQGLTLPFSVLSLAVSVAVLPRLSLAVARNDSHSIGTFLNRLIRVVSLLSFGAAAWLIVMRESLVSLAYQRGAFDQIAVQRTSEALAVYAIVIPFAGVYSLLLRGLLAFSKSRLILVISLVGLALNLGLDLLFLRSLEHIGIALSSLCVQVVYVLVALVMLDRELAQTRFIKNVLSPLIANGSAALLAVGSGLALASHSPAFLSTRAWGPWLLVQSIVVITLYVGLSAMFGACDYSWAKSFALRAVKVDV